MSMLTDDRLSNSLYWKIADLANENLSRFGVNNSDFTEMKGVILAAMNESKFVTLYAAVQGCLDSLSLVRI
jgi:hypothetical protein